MNWIERWQALSARIVGLMEAGNFLIQAYAVENQNTGAVRRLLDELRQIHGELKKLYDDCNAQMPSAAAMALKMFCSEGVPPPSPSGDAVELQPLAVLHAFRGRFNYLIRDSEIEARNATELAFEHLQRLIAVDDRVRSCWKGAFDAGEIACEKLGSVHLLAHRIWAFKVKGSHAETDLVYGDTSGQSHLHVHRVARAMVLTEWKVVRDEKKTEQKASEARREAKEYSAGILGDLELKQTRYIVLVALRQRTAPSDVEEHGVCYRHIWLAVDPETPSKIARVKE